MAQISAFTAYFDASGHPSDQPFVVVSGYVANFMQWQVFNANWTETHKRFGMPIPFHATDFMHRKEPYDKWGKDSQDARLFLTSLCTAQQLNMLLSVSCIVDMGDYREIGDVVLIDTMLPAFALGARWCVAILEGWQKEHGIEYPIECVFEDGDFGRGKFIELMRTERMPTPIFKDKKEFPGLQAADHIAWEQGSHMKRELKAGTALPASESFARLLAIPHLHKRTDLGNLLDICEKKGVPIKRGKIIRP
jgi:hypothetical protein